MRLALIGALALLTLSCGVEEDEVALRGSVARVYDLSYDAVRARLSETELAIQYVDGGQVVAQAVVRVPALAGPAAVDLAMDGDVLGRRDGTALPEMRSGTLRLTAYAATDGARVAGDFDSVLVAGDNELTLVGSFDTTLQDLRAE